MSMRWEELTLDNFSALVKVFELYDHAFPIEVREPHHIFDKSLQYAQEENLNHFRLLVGFEGEKLVSFATGHYLANVNAGFIVYIVTSPTRRSKGVGTQTLLKIEELLNEDAISAGHSSLKAICLETETKEMAHTEEEKENWIKRERFYTKNNYHPIHPINYLQPPLHKGGNPVPLNLYMKQRQTSEVTERELMEIIRAIYREKYYKVNGINIDMLNACLEDMGLLKLVEKKMMGFPSSSLLK